MFPARQWGLVGVVTGGADCDYHDERTDGQYVAVKDLCW